MVSYPQKYLICFYKTMKYGPYVPFPMIQEVNVTICQYHQELQTIAFSGAITVVIYRTSLWVLVKKKTHKIADLLITQYCRHHDS